MKAKLLISSLLLGTAILAIAKGDPVLMTINGKDIKLSEFEYLYHKNNQQQIEKETLEQYVDRFVLFKQKVAAAEDAGIDTTDVFIREFEVYQKELATPYMKDDTTYRWQFIEEAYERYKKEIDIDHFMLPLGNTPEATQANMNLMDSLRNCILNGENWGDLVLQYSSDPYKMQHKGHYGYVSAAMFPSYTFENVLYNTPKGGISAPFKTTAGVHMIRVNEIRDRNDVHVKHIIKIFPKNATDEQKAAIKHQMDSIYDLLKAGASFEELAKKESQDGTAPSGGELPWFGRGRMVQPFEDVSFSLADGEISKPIETTYGYHIIKKLDHGMMSLAEFRPSIDLAISKDERAKLINERRLQDLKNKYNYVLNPNLDSYLTKALEANGGNYDSTFVAQSIKGVNMPLFTYGNKQSVPVADLLPQINYKNRFIDIESAKNYLLTKVDVVANKVLTEHNARELVKSNPEYRNLINEYRDGMLLFEISNRRVWKAASKDTVGLEQYFAANRDKYNWDEPRFKGIIIFTWNDSILDLIKADMKTMAPDTLADGLYNKYNKDNMVIRMERMVVKKGENVFADYLAFHEGEKPDRPGYNSFMILQGGLIDQPEEMSDVRGLVSSDYQDVLEQRWQEELAAKYPAKINKNVLKKVK